MVFGLQFRTVACKERWTVGQGFPRHFWAAFSTDLELPEKNRNGHAAIINKWIIWALQGRVLTVEGRGRGTMPASLEGKQ